MQLVIWLDTLLQNNIIKSSDNQIYIFKKLIPDVTLTMFMLYVLRENITSNIWY